MFLELQNKHPKLPWRQLALQVSEVIGRGIYTARKIIQWELELLEKGYITRSNVGRNTNMVESLLEDKGVELALCTYLTRAGEGNISSLFKV